MPSWVSFLKIWKRRNPLELCSSVLIMDICTRAAALPTKIAVFSYQLQRLTQLQIGLDRFPIYPSLRNVPETNFLFHPNTRKAITFLSPTLQRDLFRHHFSLWLTTQCSRYTCPLYHPTLPLLIFRLILPSWLSWLDLFLTNTKSCSICTSKALCIPLIVRCETIRRKALAYYVPGVIDVIAGIVDKEGKYCYFFC